LRIVAIGSPPIGGRIQEVRSEVTMYGEKKLRGSWCWCDCATTASGCGQRTTGSDQESHEFGEKARPTTSWMTIDQPLRRRWRKSPRAKAKAANAIRTAKVERTRADAVWPSNRGMPNSTRGQTRKPHRESQAAKEPKGRKKRLVLPRSPISSRSSLSLGRSSRRRRRVVPRDQIRTVPGAMRVVSGKGSMRTRKAWIGPPNSRPSRGEEDCSPTLLVDGEIVALDHMARDRIVNPAGCDLRRQDRQTLIFFAFDRFVFADGMDFALQLGERKQRFYIKSSAGIPRQGQQSPVIRYLEIRERRRCDFLQSARKL